VDYHLEAEVAFLRTADGGRASDIWNDFRPNLVYAGHWAIISLAFPGREYASPGEIAITHIRFMVRPEFHCPNLPPGATFALHEGPQVIARGRLTRVLTT
jgi:hypothetical protein